MLFAGDRPKPAAAYRDSGAVILDTASGGSIGFRLRNGGLQPELYRQQRRRYWQLPVEEG